jgi:polysaccharide export outer membrane protein
MKVARWLAMVVLFALLAGCSLPRGAAVQQEILAGRDDEFPEFAVYEVDRAFLAQQRGWPRAAAPAAGWPSGAPSGRVADMRISPFDMVNLVVWDSEDNSLLTSDLEKLVNIPGLRVTEGGEIFVPYIGYLDVAGRTPDSARQLVEREITAIVPSAQVQLSVEPGTRGSVNLVGGVAAPGPVPLPEANFTVLDAIAAGGGPAEDLRNPQVQLVRGGRTYRASYDSLLEQPSRDTVLRGGDRLALVQDDRYFRAFGAIDNEQLVYFEDESLTALDALSLMGGLNDRRADPRGILVLRDYPASTVRHDGSGPSNRRTIFVIDLTTSEGLFSAGEFEIEDRDLVMATESVVTAGTAIIGLIGTLAGLSNIAN